MTFKKFKCENVINQTLTRGFAPEPHWGQSSHTPGGLRSARSPEFGFPHCSKAQIPPCLFVLLLGLRLKSPEIALFTQNSPGEDGYYSKPSRNKNLAKNQWTDYKQNFSFTKVDRFTCFCCYKPSNCLIRFMNYNMFNNITTFCHVLSSTDLIIISVRFTYLLIMKIKNKISVTTYKLNFQGKASSVSRSKTEWVNQLLVILYLRRVVLSMKFCNQIFWRLVLSNEVESCIIIKYVDA